MDLTEAEDIKKRQQKYTEELYKKDHHDPHNHGGTFTHLEPDILECEVKWALESITMNKESGGDGIAVELFQILKDDALKCCTQYANKFGKLSNGYRTGKDQFSRQSQRKACQRMLKLLYNCTHFTCQQSESEVAQSCLTLSDPKDCGPPGSSVHGILQARELEWGQW